MLGLAPCWPIHSGTALGSTYCIWESYLNHDYGKCWPKTRHIIVFLLSSGQYHSIYCDDIFLSLPHCRIFNIGWGLSGLRPVWGWVRRGRAAGLRAGEAARRQDRRVVSPPLLLVSQAGFLVCGIGNCDRKLENWRCPPAGLFSLPTLHIPARISKRGNEKQWPNYPHLVHKHDDISWFWCMSLNPARAILTYLNTSYPGSTRIRPQNKKASQTRNCESYWVLKLINLLLCLKIFINQ